MNSMIALFRLAKHMAQIIVLIRPCCPQRRQQKLRKRRQA